MTRSVAHAICFVVFGLAANPVAAAPIRPVDAQQLDNAITVTGASDMKVMPDVAYASLQIITQDRNQSTAVATNAARTQSVMDALRKSMIEDRDIQTASYSVNPTYDYQSSPPALVGYQVVNALRVTIHDVGKAGLIVDKATAAGAASVEGVQFDIADRSKAIGLALVEAVRNARSKADLIAGAAGVQVGRVLRIDETAAPIPQPLRLMSALAVSAPKTTTPIQSQEIEIDASVTIAYAIEYGS